MLLSLLGMTILKTGAAYGRPGHLACLLKPSRNLNKVEENILTKRVTKMATYKRTKSRGKSRERRPAFGTAFRGVLDHLGGGG